MRSWVAALRWLRAYGVAKIADMKRREWIAEKDYSSRRGMNGAMGGNIKAFDYASSFLF